jgi:hypothetical protein
MTPYRRRSRFLRASKNERRVLRGAADSAIASVEQLESRIALTVSPFEQEFIYLLNRARHNPAAYQVERGLTIDLSSIAQRQPLAVNTRLTDAAGFKSDEMAEQNYFSHTSVTGETPNQLVRRFGYDLPERVSVGGQTFLLPTVGNQIESLAGGRPSAPTALQGLIESTGHRNHLLGVTAHNQVAKEVGIGYRFRDQATYKHYWTVLITPSKVTTPLLTGVAFVDGNRNTRFEGSEGLGNVRITASGPNGSFTTNTTAAGGWAMPVPAGDYIVTASGGGFSGSSSAPVRVGSQNVAVDFISGTTTAWVNFSQPNVAVPGLPTSVVATAGNTQATLTWAAPASNGGGAITNYVIQFSSNRGGAWTTFNRAASASTSATVTGLVNGTNYIFRVAAVNSAGTSGFSNNSNSVRPVAQIAVPGSPTGVVATAGNGRVTLRWNAPASNGGSPITRYAVQLSTDNGNSWVAAVIPASSRTSASVTGLSNGSQYIFRVAAVNVAGVGAYTTSIAGVTPVVGAVTSIDLSAFANRRLQSVGFGAVGQLPEGDVTLGGVRFAIPVGGNNVWTGEAAIGGNPRTLDVPVNAVGVTRVHTLINTLWGERDRGARASITFFGSAGAVHTVELDGNNHIRDYLWNTWTNAINSNSAVNVFTAGSGQGIGSNNQVRLDMQTFTLPAPFASQTLTRVRVSDWGRSNYQRLIVSGITIR